ncbi:MAG: protein kinase [Acidobacteriia bacterium]|nr:protein kinase [Terriglobia bacterium]
MAASRSLCFFRFGAFQLDLRARELRRNGVKVRLPDQSIQVLAMLLEQPGEVVTREEVHQRLWPNGTIVEFDHSINAAIKRLRQALGDSAEAPRYVETLPRLGYRFIGAVEPAPATTPERLSQIEEVFHSARECEPEERAAFLAEACREDEELRREVESLLAAEGTTSALLGAPMREAAAILASQQGQSQHQLAPGLELGPYMIEARLGAGGMGEVYRGKDKRLRRTVALKVLSPHLARTPGLQQRLEREAAAISSLNHPNICTLYDIGRQDEIDYLVMEFLEGETLAQRLKRGALPLPEVLESAIQITSALAAAHSKGIIHRDIKPANIFVVGRGQVKVLDFGLAKLKEPPPGSECEMVTSEESLTAAGLVVGTVGYMSPEQAEGKRVDTRSDIFSTGSVLYEMVTGRRAFQGDSKLSTLSAILKNDPKPVSAVVPDVPCDLEKIIARCLRRDPERRFQYMADVKVTLEEVKEEWESAKLNISIGGRWRKQKSRLLWAVSGIALLVLTALGVGLWFLRPAPQATQKTVPFTSYPGRQISPAFSPDGKQVAFAWDGEQGGNFDIYVKLVDAGTPLRLTSSPADEWAPAWSPDARYIAFCRDKYAGVTTSSRLSPYAQWFGNLPDHIEIWMIPALGGAERKLGESAGCGLSWSPDGKYLAMVDKSGPREPSSIFWLSIETGDKRKVTSPPTEYAADWSPRFSPDGKTLAFVRSYSNINDEVCLLSVTSDGRPLGEPRRLTLDGRSIFGLDWTADGRRIVYSSGQESSTNLLTILASGGAPERLAVAGFATALSVSRSGSRLAYERDVFDTNIWRIPGPNSTGMKSAPSRFIASTEPDAEPQFSPDGAKIAFGSARSGNYEIWVCDPEGRNPVQLTSFGGVAIGSPRLSPDSRWVAFDSPKAGNGDIYVVSADGGQPRRLTSGPSNNVRPSWSQDGRWIYFGSDRSGDWQIWKEPAQGGTAVQVTKSGGEEAFESIDGKFVYYAKLDAPGVWKVPVAGGEETRVLDRTGQNSWALTGQGICFFDFTGPAGTTLKFYNFATGKVTLLREFSKDTQVETSSTALTVSPDVRWILYTQLDRSGSDLMLVENYR